MERFFYSYCKVHVGGREGEDTLASLSELLEQAGSSVRPDLLTAVRAFLQHRGLSPDERLRTALLRGQRLRRVERFR